MISIIIGEIDPLNQVAEIYYDMLKNEKDKKLRRILENKEYVLKMNNAMQKVWKRKQSEEEKAMKEQQAKINEMLKQLKKNDTQEGKDELNKLIKQQSANLKTIQMFSDTFKVQIDSITNISKQLDQQKQFLS